ncbi:hypothetical protein C8R43DRAFT_1122736 [Mycena crocata]|nr:hypothetical protein C8R43DRAFT_1122736 [Mycena crocata]
MSFDPAERRLERRRLAAQEYRERNRANDAAYREGNAAAIHIRMKTRRLKAKRSKRKAELARMVEESRQAEAGRSRGEEGNVGTSPS